MPLALGVPAQAALSSSLTNCAQRITGMSPRLAMAHGNAANFGRSSCDLACASKARSPMAAKPLASSSSLEAEAAVPTLPLPLLPELAGCALSCPLLVTAPRLIAALSCPCWSQRHG